MMLQTPLPLHFLPRATCHRWRRLSLSQWQSQCNGHDHDRDHGTAQAATTSPHAIILASTRCVFSRLSKSLFVTCQFSWLSFTGATRDRPSPRRPPLPPPHSMVQSPHLISGWQETRVRLFSTHHTKAERPHQQRHSLPASIILPTHAARLRSPSRVRSPNNRRTRRRMVQPNATPPPSSSCPQRLRRTRPLNKSTQHTKAEWPSPTPLPCRLHHASTRGAIAIAFANTFSREKGAPQNEGETVPLNATDRAVFWLSAGFFYVTPASDRRTRDRPISTPHSNPAVT
ncbi:hypothetical protein F5148DRAFT_387316 [Russula earlei]|uniref:Uncharacterized protein n=1 Tax=Russula earlei TaxID=71964 RepID=A0ACC0U087_9AGAM|nr:hypothetical protein F5148DRAFT_387316 [Russula earlei]